MNTSIKIIDTQTRLCTCCMEEHEVKTVLVRECATFKGYKVDYEARYYLCEGADAFYMDEQQTQVNDILLKDAYRKQVGLLTSGEINSIRAKYGISQSDLCLLLGWGAKTITRYESHQVQDRAHDMILRQIDRDPEWFLTLLVESKENLTKEAFRRYHAAASNLYKNARDTYLRKAIEAEYAVVCGGEHFQGEVSFSLDKTVDAIRYLAAPGRIADLSRRKLMTLLWHADEIAKERRGAAITGLVYRDSAEGTVPVAFNLIMELDGVPGSNRESGEVSEASAREFSSLSEEEMGILEGVLLWQPQVLRQNL